jgi:hypothetical protein
MCSNNWELDKIFQNSTAPDDYIHLRQTIYHRPFIILSGFDYLPDAIELQYNNLWSDTDDIHQQQMIFIYSSWFFYSSKREDDGCLPRDENQPMKMIIKHWVWRSTDLDDKSSALDKFIICGKWFFENFIKLPIIRLGRYQSSISDDNHP